MAKATAKFDVYQHVTDSIVAHLEAGTPPWRKPWTGTEASTAFPKRSTGEYYQGINVILLWLTAMEREFKSAHWFTYKQAAEQGGQVRKGEKSTQVIYFNTVERENADGETKAIPFAKVYRVFNADQIDGLPDSFYRKAEPPKDLGTQADPALDRLFGAMGIKTITHDKPQAFYRHNDDCVYMPPIATFFEAGRYYSVLAHEYVHATGAKHRVGRFDDQKRDRKSYAFEELVAEIGACMLLCRLGIAPDFADSTSYIDNWLKALQDDKRLIFKAASASSKAMDWLCGQLEASGMGIAA